MMFFPALIVHAVGCLAVFLCDTSIPCQNIDVGVLTGSFNASDTKQSVNSTRIFLTTVIDTRYMDIVPHFIDHYSRCGIESKRMLFLLHTFNNTSQEYARAVQFFREKNVTIAEWMGPFSATAALYHRLHLLQFLSSPDWLLYADVDEFVNLTAPIPTFVQTLIVQGYTSASGHLIDRVSASGVLTNISASIAIEEQFPLRCQLTSKLLKGANYKIVFASAMVRANSGNHDLLTAEWYNSNKLSVPAFRNVTYKRYPGFLKIDHFKWSAGIIDSLTKRIDYYRHELRASYWSESDRFLREYNKTNRIDTNAFCTTQHHTAIKVPSQAETRASVWRVRNDVPLCHVGNSLCITPNGSHSTTSICANLTAPYLDRSFANAVRDSVVQISSLLMHETGPLCYSFYWATDGKLSNFSSTNSLNASSTSNNVLHADFVIDLDVSCSAVSCMHLADLTNYAYRGVVLALRASTEQKTQVDLAVMTSQLHALGFYQDNYRTNILRGAATSSDFKCCSSVYMRHRLLTKKLSTQFLQHQNDNIDWNKRLVFAGDWYRIYIPPNLVWVSYKLVIGVLNQAKTIERRNVIRETWGLRAKLIGALVIFVIASPTRAEQHEANQYGDIVLLETTDIWKLYNSTLPFKTFAWLQIATQYAVAAEWVMKCDDDTFIFPNRLSALLTRYPEPSKRNYFIGCGFQTNPVRDARDSRSYVASDIYPPTQYPVFMSGGAGYVLSISPARCLAIHSQTKEFWFFHLEDVSVRLALDNACRPYDFIDRSDVFKPNIPSTVHNNTVTIHYVKTTSKVHELWRSQIKM